MVISIGPRQLKENNKPLVLVEGPTDTRILNEAWSKLHPEQEMPFVLRAADPSSNTGQSSGGAGTLAKMIETIHPDDERQVVAVFDHDDAGKSCYEKLDKNFKSISDLKKTHKNGYAHATTLACAEPDNDYAKTDHLCIEFLFSEEVLELKNDKGFGLEFRLSPPQVSVGKNKISIPNEKLDALNDLFGDLKYYREVKEGKKVFANEIVPKLEAECFSEFGKIFEEVLQILGDAI